MTTQHDKNKKLARNMGLVVLFMVALSFASVPLYRIFCQVTGYNGTMQIGGTPPDKIYKRQVTILFDTRVDNGLPWDFRPEVRKMTVNIGQQALVSFHGSNLSARDTIGTAIYNVTPEKAGKYFHKTQCFCFARQELAPGNSAHFPVMFYVDPSILDDKEMDDVSDITLSYTFYEADSKQLDKAIENYGTAPRQ